MGNLDLRAAIQQVEPASKAAQLRAVMPDIELKLAAGVTLAAVHQAMANAGFNVSFHTLKTYLYDFRKRQRTQAAKGSRAAAAIASESVAPNSTCPADIDAPQQFLAAPPPESPWASTVVSQSATMPVPSGNTGDPTGVAAASESKAFQPPPQQPPSPQELLRLIRPDPVEQATQFAEYERIGREMARESRKRRPST